MFRALHFLEIPSALACVTALLLIAPSAFGEIPQRMHYQGHLTLASGASVECADPTTCAQPIDLTFRIYSDPVADALLWEEDHLGVIVNGGVFNVTLGSSVPITPDLLQGPAFLGIEVNGNEELQPRQELASAAWALRCMEADDATHLGGIHAGDYVTSADAAATEAALQSQITALEEKLAALEEAVAQGGSGGGGGDDPNAPLINGNHTNGECLESAGIVTDIPGGEKLCRFQGASCPSGWTQVEEWSTTTSVGCAGKNGSNPASCGPAATCNAFGHAFSNLAPSTCCAANKCGDKDVNGNPFCLGWQACHPSATTCCTATITEVGCF